MDWKVLKGQQGNVDCPRAFIEKIVALFGMKILKFTLKLRKIPNISNFLKILFILPQNGSKAVEKIQHLFCGTCELLNRSGIGRLTNVQQRLNL